MKSCVKRVGLIRIRNVTWCLEDMTPYSTSRTEEELAIVCDTAEVCPFFVVRLTERPT